MANLIGMVFGRLTVKSKVDKRLSRGFVYSCVCECGTVKEVPSTYLVRGSTKSCGCLKKEVWHKLNYKHGQTKNPLYNTYISMLTRCYNPKAINYVNYGGRGITVCEEWRSDLGNFLSWAEEVGYDNTFDLDRINNNEGYSPSNCRFVSRSDNNVNKRIRRDNTSGFTGVSKVKGSSTYCFEVQYKGERKRSFGYRTKEEAYDGRKAYLLKREWKHPY